MRSGKGKRRDRKRRLFEYRVAKYDPAYRDWRGAYTREEWTAACQVGRVIGSNLLTPEEYACVENAYVAVALAFVHEAGGLKLRASGVENPGHSLLAPNEGERVREPRLGDLIRQLLREEFWCRLEGRRAFLHFGWDYYMYVGVARLCPKAHELAAALGLFVEEFASPYYAAPESSP